MDEKLNPSSLKKWWNVIKQIIEIIVAALAGAATAQAAEVTGLLSMLNF